MNFRPRERKNARQKTKFASVTTKKKTVKKSAPAAKKTRLKPHKPATAASILGRTTTSRSVPNGKPLVKIKPEWARFYQNLLDLRDRLLNQMSGLAIQLM